MLAVLVDILTAAACLTAVFCVVVAFGFWLFE